MRRSRFLQTRFLQLENLEQRQPLAGNITVSLSGGNLTVTGDAADNNISIYQQLNGRFNIIANDGEVITGPSTDLVFRNLTVNLGAGDDVAKVGVQTDQPFPITPALIPGVTRINGGTGANEIYVAVNGGQNGDQAIPASSIVIDTAATAATDVSGALDDNVVVANSAAATITVRTGAGNDTLQVGGSTALNLSVDTGPATTTGGMTDDDEVTTSVNKIVNADYSLGGGANRLTTFSNSFGSMSVTSGNGADIVSATGSQIARSLTINTNGGADTVFLDEVTTGSAPDLAAAFPLFGLLPNLPGRIHVSTGDGDDLVYALRLDSALINMALQGGDDTLYASDIDAVFALFNGGPGTDGKYSDAIAGSSNFLSFEEELENPFPN